MLEEQLLVSTAMFPPGNVWEGYQHIIVPQKSGDLPVIHCFSTRTTGYSQAANVSRFITIFANVYRRAHQKYAPMFKPAFMLAAPSSNTGKTTLTLALLRIMAGEDYRVQPFKCGPDYIDTLLHTIAAGVGGRSCRGINLDTFMAGKQHIREVFLKHCNEAGAAVVEGVMGLFDGAVKSQGSSAEIAKLLDISVILVVDAKGCAYSVAPLIYGFKHFDPAVHLAGVIFNRVNTRSHYEFLKDACCDVGIEPLGYVPHNESIAVSERYLGLNISAGGNQESAIEAMACHVRKTVDVKRLLEITSMDIPAFPQKLVSIRQGDAVIAVARDEAFNFVYAENLDVLAEYGKLEFFSPLDDGKLPEADMLYFSGGYPELYAERLEQNTSIRLNIAEFCSNGGIVYAECGGMMYLGNSMIDRHGVSHSMCGVFDLETSLQDAGLHLGYRKITIDDPEYCRELRGHEFHYSQITRRGDVRNVATITSAHDRRVDTGFYRFKNAFASYVHLYWGETKDFPGYLLSRGNKAK